MGLQTSFWINLMIEKLIQNPICFDLRRVKKPVYTSTA